MAQQFTARKFGNSKASSSIAIDTRELQNLGKALKKVDKEIYKKMQSHLRDIRQPLIAEAKERAGRFSKSIPPTIKASVSGLTLKLKSGSQTPVTKGHMGGAAAGMEDARNRGFYKHPVFGDKSSWVKQKSHPYLRPTIEANTPMIIRAMDKAIDEGFKGLGI